MSFTKYIFNNLLGWKIEGDFSPEIKKVVIIVVPHTSWHDFYIGVFVRRIANIQINWVGKKELFRWPLGAYFRYMGGTPIDRSSSQNKVEYITEIFNKRDEFRLSLAPEGTRKKVDKWKTGYYYIAQASNVPIIAVAFNYKTKTVTIHKPFYLTNDLEADTAVLRSYFKGAIGKNPKYA
jgi:1-acyl-sn-glycerol-3-phosphate acyltransferase